MNTTYRSEQLTETFRCHLVYSILGTGQTVLTGPSGSVCPGDLLTYTCERTGFDVTTGADPFIDWLFIVTDGRNLLLGFGTSARALNETTSVQPREGFTITGNFSSSGTVITMLQVNASSSFDGAMVICDILRLSNTLTVSVRGE